MQKLWGEVECRRRRQLLVRKLRRLLLIQRLIRFHSNTTSGSGPLPFIKQFSSKEIIRATFGLSLILGTDCDGNIYKAQFSDGLVATVRKATFSQGGSNNFYREVELLGRLYHRHLLRLRGFSVGHDRFLVFDYMENGSLKDCLHDPLRTPLNWRTRLQIAINVAAALEYLLLFCDPPVHNISIASTNVFLDENFVAKICHIGSFSSNNSNLHESDIPTCSRGSTGSKRRQHVTFQFGVLLLELITGQSFESEGDELIRWVQDSSSFSYSMHKMVDADLGDNYDNKELRSLLNIARLCTRFGGYPKISIRQILRYLQRKTELWQHNKVVNCQSCCTE